MNRRTALFAACLMLPAAGCGGGSSGSSAIAPAPSPPPPPPTPTGVPALTRSVWVSGLVNPWDLALAPDGTLLFTERARGLSARLNNASIVRLFSPADLRADGQSGMLGVALDPDFANNRHVYAYMASTASGAVDNRVVRFVVSDWRTVSSRQDIVTGISFKDSVLPGDPGGTGAHSGGRIRFGPDGFLYVTTGDNHRGKLPQDLRALGGKVLRVDRDGNAAPGNNTPAGSDPRIYTYGHRNVQGIAFRPEGLANAGQAFISEHGPGHSDEVTALVAGGNGGWDPLCANGINYCGYTSNQSDGSPTPMTDVRKFPNALKPAWNNSGRSQGMAGADFLRGVNWRDWNGAFAVAFMAGQRLDVLRLDGAGAVSSVTSIFDTLSVRIRAVMMGADGALYLTTDGKSGGDEIWRVAAN